MTRKSAILIIFICCVFPLICSAQDEDLFPGGRYNAGIPTPLDVLGHRFGQRLTFHHEMADYLKAVAAVSDRMDLTAYGETYQGRKLYLAVISSSENMARLEEIRQANLKLTDPRKTSREEAERIASTLPAIVWLGYNIHGNEATAMEAAIRVVYQLAAGEDELTRSILSNVVILIDPVQNPDGHDRHVHAVRSVVSLKSHPERLDAEHRAPWPGGRTNHYLFDLNRDWFLKTQTESRSKAVAYHRWMPHVLADVHEQGSNATYFFSPPMSPYSTFVWPDLYTWWNRFAEGNARAMDQFGWGYYTKESFDAFYPGYGSSYPCINGAVGMLFEQASPSGMSIERDDGSILTLREGAWHHFITSMATLQTASENREQLATDFYSFFASNLEAAKKDAIQEIILLPGDDPHTAAKLVENLLIEGVEVRRATEPFTNRKAISYFTKKTESKSFPAGAYIVSLNQPQRTLIKTLVAPEVPLTDAFIAEEKKRKEDGESSHFYDVTAWSMPLTYGVDAFWTAAPSNVATEIVTEKPMLLGGVTGGRAQQAYLIPNRSAGATRLFIRLLAEDIRVRIARKAFTVNGVTWPAGTLVVRVNRNQETLHSRIAELSQKYFVPVTAIGHGLADQGIDLGSGNIMTVKNPKIALLTESPVSSGGYGAIHYLFEREFDLRFTRLSTQRLSDLDAFDVLVMPSGNYKDLMDEEGLANFRQWIEKGGTVVAVSGAVGWLANESVGISAVKRLNDQPDPDGNEKKITPDRTPGAIVRVNLDSRNMLTFGCRSSVAAIARSRDIFMPFTDDEKKNVGLFESQADLRLSGFIWPETEKYLAGKVYLFVESVKRGRLICFAEDPCFRASYDGLAKLFLNAVLLGPSM